LARNPTITKVLAKVEYIEELGEGWDKIIKEHSEHPLNPEIPEIKSTTNSTLVTMFSTKEKFAEEEYVLSERQKEIIDYIKKNGKMTTSECAGLLEVSNDTSLRELSKLRSLGLIDKEGAGRSTHYVIK
jgi:ATP-dependent DNA helicase RecG